MLVPAALNLESLLGMPIRYPLQQVYYGARLASRLARGASSQLEIGLGKAVCLASLETLHLLITRPALKQRILLLTA